MRDANSNHRHGAPPPRRLPEVDDEEKESTLRRWRNAEMNSSARLSTSSASASPAAPSSPAAAVSFFATSAMQQ